MGAIETKVEMHSPKGNSHVMVEELHERAWRQGNHYIGGYAIHTVSSTVLGRQWNSNFYKVIWKRNRNSSVSLASNIQPFSIHRCKFMAHKQFFKQLMILLYTLTCTPFASYFINFSCMKKFISLQIMKHWIKHKHECQRKNRSVSKFHPFSVKFK